MTTACGKLLLTLPRWAPVNTFKHQQPVILTHGNNLKLIYCTDTQMSIDQLRVYFNYVNK